MKRSAISEDALDYDSRRKRARRAFDPIAACIRNLPHIRHRIDEVEVYLMVRLQHSKDWTSFRLRIYPYFLKRPRSSGEFFEKVGKFVDGYYKKFEGMLLKLSYVSGMRFVP